MTEPTHADLIHDRARCGGNRSYCLGCGGQLRDDVRPVDSHEASCDLPDRLAGHTHDHRAAGRIRDLIALREDTAELKHELRERLRRLDHLNMALDDREDELRAARKRIRELEAEAKP